jgi:hypothetical protein
LKIEVKRKIDVTFDCCLTRDIASVRDCIVKNPVAHRPLEPHGSESAALHGQSRGRDLSVPREQFNDGLADKIAAIKREYLRNSESGRAIGQRGDELSRPAATVMREQGVPGVSAC